MKNRLKGVGAGGSAILTATFSLGELRGLMCAWVLTSSGR